MVQQNETTTTPETVKVCENLSTKRGQYTCLYLQGVKNKDIAKRFNVSPSAISKTVNSHNIATEICKHHLPSIPLNEQYMSEEEIEGIVSSVAKALDPIMRSKKVSAEDGYEVAYLNYRSWAIAIKYDPKTKTLFEVIYDEGHPPDVRHLYTGSFENIFEDEYGELVDLIYRLEEVLYF